MTVTIPVGDARASTPDTGTSADAPPPSGAAPMSCQYADRDNPNKAELSYTISQASADLNLVSKGYTGEARVLVTYNANAKILTFAFGSPFPAVTPPCLRMSFAIYNAEPPKSGVAYTIPPNLLNPIAVVESGACSPLITMWNGWSLAMPATVTFTKVEGANVEITFNAGMGGKYSNMAAGSFTIAGTIKSPCFMTI